ncbi:MAG: acetyl-CoA carboxylase carboxyltransferase subunit alpha [Deltaproteobacteria bacterium]|jgi:acetyl-CoA carboxylase carboxyl transferase subunit alpha|nr:MAG: acetyl-CoA carboxylase carboxyltransferase subunit alpha [Deltaproteobacteria bacterium]
MILQYLDFERPIVDLENRLDQLRRLDDGTDKNVREEAAKLEKKIAKIRKEIFSNLTRWQITQLARHPNRPYMLDYVNLCFRNFLEIHGDRTFRDDPSIVAGFAELDAEKVVIIGQQKGRNTTEKISRNFGMAHPEGYRKALRIMKLAEKFRIPVITIIDTPGAFPGIGAEERGQSEAIARNLLEMARLETPIVVIVIGEGGSGGALAMGIGDEILMMTYAIYSVISPEGCASILWRDTAQAETAAEMMKITAPDLKKFGVVDRIIPEPEGGAHRDHKAAADLVRAALLEALASVRSLPIRQLLDRRYAKFREIGRIKRKAGGG